MGLNCDKSWFTFSGTPWREASARRCVSANYLFNKVNAILEVHAKINESPLDAFALVFFLLQHKHVMVKELLQFLVGEVNAELLKTIELQGDK